MRRFRLLAIVACFWPAIGLVAAAEPKAGDAPKNPPKNQLGEPDVGPVVAATSVLGMAVKTSDGQPIGKVADLALDLQEGYAAMVLVAEEKGEPSLLPLPIDVLKFDKSGLSLVEKFSPKTLQGTPRLKSRERLEGATRLWATAIYQQFQVEPYWHEWQKSSTWGKASKYGELYNPDKQTTINGKVDDVSYLAPLPGMAIGTQLTVSGEGKIHKVQLGPMSHLSQENVSFRPGEEVKITGSAIQIEGNTVIMAATVQTGDRTLKLRDKQGNVAWREWTPQDEAYAFASLKSLKEMPVTNAAGEDVGKIVDFAIARDTGLIAYAALACSCLPDTADKLYPIPLSALVVKPEAKAWILELPLDVLAGTPTFQVNEWPEKIERAWVEYVHVRYGRSPFGGVRSEAKKLR
jgi:sporulation protein YlmC with PRC-barrel domain